MLVLDGKIASAAVKASLLEQTNALKAAGKRTPHLAAILVGNNGASETYVASKVKNCEETGFGSSLFRFDETVTEVELLAQIEALNKNENVDGILVQLPLPKHIDDAKVIEAIDPKKDVDGFHPSNVGRLVQGLNTFIPATPYGVLLMFEHFKIETKGKRAVVIGRSNIVGRPMSILLSSDHPQGNCTVTCCHRYTPKEDLIEICSKADILVVAVGMPDFIDASMIKPGAVIIDVGITRVTDATAAKGFRIKGDVNYASAITVASAVTPVPGGVGLMTIAGLLKNTMKAYQGL
ncbi:MAG: bifunctional 5,10-methylenetetrahydrofolate dehydrogenase/5,10-methenyltetrahydrofolate cyclohydrolase [Chitinophagaceae bacterium]|jgi:methylenetetrahydrofolate dehydrogenase (NADP+)/methenyltetrahydrofolate cyclohydrolase|nr:bifunctional 5,10-methylenetetrahydrofolate dehydrogenase/5,10-methenyltetrahydrofolate cyclohydrolase [Chitinophagaceae bacterium]MCF8289845.1 bifunctional 5,10-methylenetetrahydrofolate dehydrogenase/5,10-methenyltetrahydrofolate cyclohydrolase [Chitinophagaceae bacterium]MCF8422364.1 bifunctional 5,10-methylenetetrahydrofolate dehydrogenase/5,10-methenyltetrahydrofolate cyclohydrolase [Chitinophagaceae bacterium]